MDGAKTGGGEPGRPERHAPVGPTSQGEAVPINQCCRGAWRGGGSPRERPDRASGWAGYRFAGFLALEGQIHSGNAGRIQARLIAEAANGPVTYAGDEILIKRGKITLPDLYLNAGGVAVSYFEWIKNISHIRFGRIARRFEEARGLDTIEAIERMSDGHVPTKIRSKLTAGPSEVDLVRSGLDDTMRMAYQEIREHWHKSDIIEDIRTAAFALSIQKIANTYLEMGI